MLERQTDRVVLRFGERGVANHIYYSTENSDETLGDEMAGATEAIHVLIKRIKACGERAAAIVLEAREVARVVSAEGVPTPLRNSMSTASTVCSALCW